ncbi:hypothetical protein [Tunturiibacter lichenicola]|uniref:hypothetical protein n=1 Tax=Tunturiibacter lichenicola TaxID=2051959 RepID=UPI003D9ADA35
MGNSQWFVQLLERLGHEVRIGDAAQIRASYVRRQKTEKQRHIPIKATALFIIEVRLAEQADK